MVDKLIEVIKQQQQQQRWGYRETSAKRTRL